MDHPLNSNEIKEEVCDSNVIERENDGNVSDRSSIGSPALSTTNDENKKNKTKAKRKRLLKDVNAPKAPLTGYVRFLNEHREKFREEHPDMPFHEVTKVLGQQWSSMSQEEKQQYLDEAEKEKEKYMKALEGYQQSSAYKEFQQMKKRKEAEHNENDGKANGNNKTQKQGYPSAASPKRNSILSPILQGPKITTHSGEHVPVFTEQFLDYSRKRESELRQIRKDNSVLEEQNAILNKQIDHMKNVMDHVKNDIIQQENENITMQTYLDKFRKALVDIFQKVTFPKYLNNDKLTCENIDSKMALFVDYLSTSHDKQVPELRQKVKELISKIDYPTLRD